MLEYGPYELLLEAISAEGIEGEEEDKFTSLEWIEKWWNTNDYGSSQTNRTEGSSAFAKIVEYLEIGEYKQGRRGHPSRIEWAGDAQKRINEARNEQTREEIGAESPALHNDRASDVKDDQDVAGKESGSVSRPKNNILTLNLGDERVAELSLPPRLTPHEKKRLVALVELMITTDEQADEEPQLEMGFGKEKARTGNSVRAS